MIELSIIIVSYNTRIDLIRCLDALDGSPPALAHEVIVVDNGSTDGTLEMLRSRPGVQAIEAGRNLGFAAGNNLGIRASAGAYLLLLNSDTVVPPGALDRLVAILKRHPDAAVAGPRLIDDQGRAELSFGPMISPVAEVRQRRLVRGHERGIPEISRQV